MHVVRVGLAAVAWILAAAPLAAQTGGLRVRLTGRVQFQFNTTSVSESDLDPAQSTSIAGSTFEPRRVRLGARFDLDGWISGVVEQDFALGVLRTTQTWLNLALDSTFEIRVGQFKKPFSLILLTSSLEIPMIERGLRIRYLDEAFETADRASPAPVLTSLGGTTLLGEEQELLFQLGYLSYDLGASAHGRLGAVEYEAGVFNGTGPDRLDSNDGKSVAGRLRWHAPTTWPLAIGAAASYREVDDPTSGLVTDGTAFELDVEAGAFRRSGTHVLAEAVAGDNLAVGDRFLAAQGVLSFYRPVHATRFDGIEALARLSWGDPDRDRSGDEGVLVTPGFNVYMQGRNRLQFNWDVFVPSGELFQTTHALRAQVQFAF